VPIIQAFNSADHKNAAELYAQRAYWLGKSSVKPCEVYAARGPRGSMTESQHFLSSVSEVVDAVADAMLLGDLSGGIG
jgi:hypothetical protein